MRETDPEPTETVYYHELRPRDLRRRRERCPVAYLGMGILEWHGLHNPLGLDGVKADALAAHLARVLGGVVMPPLYWGDHRREVCEIVFDPEISPWLPEGTGDHTAEIAGAMGIARQAMERDASRSERAGGWRLWKELVVHVLFQIEALGFERAVLIPGHYPLFGPLGEAIKRYGDAGGTLSSLVLTDNLYDPAGNSGDHAAAFETSMLLALRPQLVDMTELDPDPDVRPTGVLGDDPRVHASAVFGWSIVERMVGITRDWLVAR